MLFNYCPIGSEIFWVVSVVPWERTPLVVAQLWRALAVPVGRGYIANQTGGIYSDAIFE